MKINRMNLINSLNKVLPGIATGTVQVDGADTIIFNNGHIYSYNSTISVDVTMPEEFDLKGVIKGQDFYNCITKLPGEEIDLEVTDSAWNITDNNIKVSIKLLPAKEELMRRFETLKPTDDWYEIDGEDFNKSLKVCLIKGNNSSFGGIYYDGNVAFSTDKWTINRMNMKNEYPKFWISDNAVSELTKWNNFIKVQYNKGWIHFLSADDVVFSVRPLDVSKYPIASIQPLLENELQNTIAFDVELTSSFYEAVNRAIEFSHVIDEHETICVEFGKEVKIKGSRNSGNYEETVTDMSVDIPNPKEMNFDYNDFISSEKFFNKLKVISDTQDFDETESVHVILEADTAVKLFSSMSTN